MKNTYILFFLIFFGSFSTLVAQTTQAKLSDENSNPVKVKIQAKQTFKEPLAVEIFSTNEKDAGNRAIVNGLTIKGNISVLASPGKKLAGGAGGGAAAASYAATGRMAVEKILVTIIQRETGDEASTYTDANGNFSLTLKHDTLHTIIINGTEYGQVKLKTKHDTAKNAIGNIR